MIWGALLIPVIAAAILYFKFNRFVTWWELLLPLGASLIVIFAFKFSIEHVQCTDTEYWTGYGQYAEYYEPWDEEVACQHPITDNKGNTIGHMHVYDVDYHPACWYIHSNADGDLSISKSHFEQLAVRWHNRKYEHVSRFVTYHTLHGQKYVTRWDNDDKTIEICTTTHHYQNRILASESIFGFAPVDKEDKKNYQLVDYPETKSYFGIPSILGDGGPTTASANAKLCKINAHLGREKQIRIWIVNFIDQPLEAGIQQMNYWQGGNKNELILCIGQDVEHKVTWGHVFSWTEVEGLKIDCRNAITDQEGKTLNLNKLIDEIIPKVQEQWQRKHFKDFDYLSVEPPWWAVLLTYLATIGVNVGVCIWAIKNQYA